MTVNHLDAISTVLLEVEAQLVFRFSDAQLTSVRVALPTFANILYAMGGSSRYALTVHAPPQAGMSIVAIQCRSGSVHIQPDHEIKDLSLLKIFIKMGTYSPFPILLNLGKFDSSSVDWGETFNSPLIFTGYPITIVTKAVPRVEGTVPSQQDLRAENAPWGSRRRR